MKTVILAGGTGKRVFPLAVNKPKPMFKILGKPLILHVIETMKKSGLKDFIIVTGHNAEQIKEYLKDGSDFGVDIQYTDQKESLGMANALESAKDLVENNFFVINADDIFEPRLIEDMVKKFNTENADIVLSYKPVKETWKFGIIKIEDGNVTKFVEKPPKGKEPSNLAVIGAYIMSKKIFDYYEKIPVSDHQYEDAIQKFIEDKNIVKAVSYDGFFAAYKYPWDLFTLNKYLMDREIKKQIIEDGVDISEKAQIKGNVWIKKGTKIFGNASIKGPCYIGSNSVVGNNSLVRDYSSIGDNCVVGFSTEVKHSLVGNSCWFHTNYIGDSIISDNCVFGSGSVTANFRFDEKNIKVEINGKKIDSGMDKLGAIMADNCKAGINSSILPGIKVGPHSIVGPEVCLGENLEPNKIIMVDRKSYLVKENKTTFPDKRDEMMKRLLKYKKS